MHVAIPEGVSCPIEQLLTVVEPLIDAVEADIVVTFWIFADVTVVVLENFFDVFDGVDFFHGCLVIHIPIVPDPPPLGNPPCATFLTGTLLTEFSIGKICEKHNAQRSKPRE